jgi:hypothetical protein
MAQYADWYRENRLKTPATPLDWNRAAREPKTISDEDTQNVFETLLTPEDSVLLKGMFISYEL